MKDCEIKLWKKRKKPDANEQLVQLKSPISKKKVSVQNN
jgi:hypothetical protein